jgi:hypothetical protein
LIAATAGCQGFDETARALARKIAAHLEPREAVTLSVSNVASTGPSEVAGVREAIAGELRALGVNTTGPAQAGTVVTVMLSEDIRGALWAAEIRHGDAREVVMEERPKLPATASTASIVIDKKLMLEEDERILDLAPTGRGLVVLDAAAVSLYESSGGAWERRLSIRIPVSRPWPRDLRGRLTVQGDAYQAHLPGLACNGNAGGGMSITCREESLWPIGTGPRMLGFAQFTAARNFFSGRVVAPNGAEKSVPAFFSAAEFQVRESTGWVLSGVDGRAYIYSTVKNNSAWEGWGSSMAGIESGCGARSQVFATAPGDDTVPDSVRAYDIVEGAPRSAGEVTFSGPVTELWPAAERGVAFAISRDLKSGRYAAFRLAITCAH